MNYLGLASGIATLIVIGLGFPLVIYAERFFSYLIWPYMLGVGTVLIAVSVLTPLNWLSIGLGIVGATFAWSSTELREQAIRAEIGWYPLNPRKFELPFYSLIRKMRAPHL